jgi:hypothetical protein
MGWVIQIRIPVRRTRKRQNKTMCETLRTVLSTNVGPRFKTLDNVDFARQRRERLLDFLYLFGRRSFLEFKQHDVFQHFWACLRRFTLYRNAAFFGVNVYTPAAYNRYYSQTQHISKHLQLPPIFIFVLKPTMRQILPARKSKFYAKILQTCRGIIAYY